MRQELRGYQVGAEGALRAALSRVRRVCLQLATGGGKTTIAAHFIEAESQAGHRTLFLAHRRELIFQCSERLDEHGIDHGIVMAANRRDLPLLPVQVASVQTLSRRVAPSHFHNIFIDEAHRATASTYMCIVDMYPGANVIGITATPARLGGRGLGDLFDELVIGAPPSELIRDGWLVNTSGFCYDNPDVSTVDVKSTGDYDPHGLELSMNKRTILGNIYERWAEHASHLRTIVFACTLNHSRDLVAEFRSHGVNAFHIDGETPYAQRAEILAGLKTGNVQVVVNVGVLTEGFDAPAVGCIILARPTKSLTLHIQMSGRGCRPACLRCGEYAHPGWSNCTKCGSANVKRTLRLHDHAGNCLAHGLPLEDRDWSLQYSKAKDPSLTNLKTCPNCLAIISNLCSVCTVCGHVFAPKARSGPIITDGNVIELSDVEARRKRDRESNEKFQTFKNLARIAAERGYRPGWVYKVYVGKYHVAPDSAWARMVGL